MHRSPFSHSRWHRWLWFALSVALLDQATKYLAEARLLLYEPLSITPFFNLRLAYNSGAAFSFLSDASGWQRWFFIAIGIGVAVLIIHWLRTVGSRSSCLASGLMLMLGGDCGNIWDRIFRNGAVVDFLDFHLGNAHWPTFNIADSAICAGLILVFAVTLRESSQKGGVKSDP